MSAYSDIGLQTLVMSMGEERKRVSVVLAAGASTVRQVSTSGDKCQEVSPQNDTSVSDMHRLLEHS